MFKCNGANHHLLLLARMRKHHDLPGPRPQVYATCAQPACEQTRACHRHSRARRDLGGELDTRRRQRRAHAHRVRAFATPTSRTHLTARPRVQETAAKNRFFSVPNDGRVVSLGANARLTLQPESPHFLSVCDVVCAWQAVHAHPGRLLAALAGTRPHTRGTSRRCRGLCVFRVRLAFHWPGTRGADCKKQYDWTPDLSPEETGAVLVDRVHAVQRHELRVAPTVRSLSGQTV